MEQSEFAVSVEVELVDDLSDSLHDLFVAAFGVMSGEGRWIGTIGHVWAADATEAERLVASRVLSMLPLGAAVVDLSSEPIVEQTLLDAGGDVIAVESHEPMIEPPKSL